MPTIEEGHPELGVIQDEMNKLESAISEVERQIDGLENKLSSVMVNSDRPGLTPGPDGNAIERCPLACGLADMTGRVGSVIDRVSDLLSRIQV